jgi:hypothetical protein
MAEKIKCDCGVIFTPEEGQTHCNYCGIKLSDIGKKKPARLAKEDETTLSESQKKKIEEEEKYRTGVRKDLGKKKRGKGCLILIGLLIGFFILIAAISGGGKKVGPPGIQQQTVQKAGLPEEVDKIEVAGKTISVGDSADDVFETVTDKYKIDSPTIEGGRITHHFLDDKVLFDMTFERSKTQNYYVLTKIVIKDRDYQETIIEATRSVIGKPPVEYETGYSSGVLITIFVPQSTTKTQLKELLRYFHSLSEQSLLSKVMKGHTVIDIFDDKKWTIKENYDSLTQGPQYCDYIKATYSIGIDGVERAGIGNGNCPNYEEVIKPSSPTPTTIDDFKASVRFTGTQFVIANLDDLDCQNAKMEINGGIIRSGYILDGYTLEAGKTYEVGALQFAKSDGTRFNPFETKPKDFFIMCRGRNALDGASWLGEF